MIEGLQMTIPRRMAWVKITLVLSVITFMALSFNLWRSERHFPLTPVIETENLIPPYDILYPAFTVLLLLCGLLLRWGRLFLFLALLLSVWMVINDLSRLQPWFYVYNSMLVIFILYNGRVDEPNRYTSFFILLQVILASTYFFAGFHRLHPEYISSEFVTLISPIRDHVSERQFALFARLGSAVPYVLMFIGMGLMITPIRYLAIALAALAHVLLLIFLFPSDSNQNYTLWLSNLSGLIMVALLFSGKTKQRYYSPSFIFQMPVFYIIAVMFLVLPVFSPDGHWPALLSSDFRNGKAGPATIRVAAGVYNELSDYEQRFYRYERGDYVLDLRSWCRTELRSELYTDMKIYNSVANYLRKLDAGAVKVSELPD